ncbi:uncharacterized protein LOC143037143 [Oratosquilla oratoria]|uniref:uncharacterized protein LOC143037143 n=1 Tax=Oratosquilla oratoria TaxID=337810 RepID=UPI003F75D1F6
MSPFYLCDVISSEYIDQSLKELSTRNVPDTNMSFKILILLGFIALAAGDHPSQFYGTPEQDSHEHEHDNYGGPARYKFAWAVKDYSGNDFGHQESREDEHTQGSYYAQLPDGRLQKVNYKVEGNSGYVANVEYEGEAHYPDASDEDKRTYGPPQPSPLYGLPN